MCYLFMVSCHNEKSSTEKNPVKTDSILVSKEAEVPHNISFWLTEEQVKKMKLDSIAFWNIYQKNAAIRKDSLSKLNWLSFKERDEMIKDSLTHWQKNKKAALLRELKKNNRIDSLQRIVHPINYKLPFGPKPLGRLIDNNQNNLGFKIFKEDSLLDAKGIQTRKDVYETWLYFLEFHTNEDADLGEDYVEQLMPSHDSFQYLNIRPGFSSNNEYFDPKYADFQIRISDIGIYEVYYSTTGSDYPYSCSTIRKTEQNCCYGEDYMCESTGYIILFDHG